MATPQLENGYVKIANELFEAIIKFKLPGNELRIVLFIIRKTYGYNKKSDWISNSQFVAGTGINKSNVCRSINCLVLKKIVDRQGNKITPSYRLNKNYWQWELLTAKATNPKIKLLTSREMAVDRQGNSGIVDPSDNQNDLSSYSSEQVNGSELLTSKEIGENELLTAKAPTKDSNNVTKERTPPLLPMERKQLISDYQKIVNGSTNHVLMMKHTQGNESYEIMRDRISLVLIELKREN